MIARPLACSAFAFFLLSQAGCGSLGAYNLDLIDTGASGVDGDADTDVDADADADADADTDVDVDTDADTDTTDCVPDLWDLGSQGSTGATFAPVYFGMSVQGVVNSGAMEDFGIDGTDQSAIISFDFYDATPAYLCSALFDASTSLTPTAGGWSPDEAAGAVWAAWDVSVTAADGFTDCPTLSNGTDPRDWAASRTALRIGLGSMPSGAFRSNLQTAVEASAPGTWATDWNAQLFGVYLDIGDTTDYLMGYGFSYQQDACNNLQTSTIIEVLPPGNGVLDSYFDPTGTGTVFDVTAVQ